MKGTDPIWTIHFQLQERETTNDTFTSIVTLDVTIDDQALQPAAEAAAKSGLKEADLTAADGASQLKWLVHNVAHHADALRTAVKEAGDLGDDITVDVFTTLTRELDKDLWFLEAHLQA